MPFELPDILRASNRQRLSIETMRQIFAGGPVNESDWLTVRRTCEALAASRAEVPSDVIALATLAYAVTADDLEGARAAALRIVEGDAHGLTRALADAAVALKNVRLAPSSRDSLSRFATSLFKLGRFHTTREEYLAVHRRMIESLLRYFELCRNDDEVRQSLPEASDLTGAVSQLASKCGVGAYLDDGILWGERVVSLNADITGKMAVGVWVIANNLHNIYRWLARDHPTAALHFFEHRLATATTEARALANAGVDAPPNLLERTLRGLIAVHVTLAALKPPERSEHAAKARAAVAAYAALQPDEEFQRHVAVMRQEVEQQLSSTGTPNVYSPAQRNPDSYDAAIDRLTQQARDVTAAIRSSSDVFDRQRRLRDVLDEWYVDLERDLSAVVVDAGLDYDVCKMIVALGMIAGGTLGPVSSEALRTWTWKVDDADRTRAGPTVGMRQYLSIGGGSDEARQSGWARLVALSELADGMRDDSGVPAEGLLRTRNAVLLKRVLTTWPCGQHHRSATIGRREDVNDLLAGLPAEMRQRFAAAYDSA